jgi:y4mF family transcriptional regulator
MAVIMGLYLMSKNPFFEYVASVVRAHRKQSGLSQQALAKYAGVGKTVVFDIEHAKESIQLNTLLKILAVLNIDIQLTSPLIKQMKAKDNA